MFDSMLTLVDQSIALVRRAVAAIGKKPLASRVELSDELLRNVDDPDYSPTVRSLRKLETAARAVLNERGEPVPVCEACVPDDMT